MRWTGGLVLISVLAFEACGGHASESNAGSSSAGSSSAGEANAGAPGTAGTGSSAAGDAGPAGGATPDAGQSGFPLGVAGNGLSTPHDAPPCESPTPLKQGGGYDVCADGSLRRPSAAHCASALPRPAPDKPLAFDECTSDTDCVAHAHGLCAYGACEYGCVEDSECPSDQACFCGESIGRCVPANCRSDADCAADLPCTAYVAFGYRLPDVVACQSPNDECLTTPQCKSPSPRVSCRFEEDHRICFRDPVG